MIPYHGSQPARPEGHYESWFLRGNHPSKPQAFWIRFTRFIPGDGKRKPLGEIWAIWFDGESDQVITTKQEFAHDDCRFDEDKLSVRVGNSELLSHVSRGNASLAGHQIHWSLDYEGADNGLLFLPENLYKSRLPRAKSVISRPQVKFNGTLTIDDKTINVTNWSGSENHNWGSRHTDQYAWGQVAAFDNAPDAFLECITARVKFGQLISPAMTIAVLRLDGEDLMFNTLGTAWRAKASYDFFNWTFSTSRDAMQLEVQIQAPAQHFAALTYYNPSRGSKTCLNSKIAQCRAILTRADQPPLMLESKHGAAFEILTERSDHGRPLMT